jgi:hypothetical protein
MKWWRVTWLCRDREDTEKTEMIWAARDRIREDLAILLSVEDPKRIVITEIEDYDIRVVGFEGEC